MRRREWVTSALEVAGLAAVVVGAFLVAPPLALILGGAAALLVSWRVSR